MKTPQDRMKIFNLLQSKGYVVPFHGKVSDLIMKFNGELPCVIYLKDYSLGKVKTNSCKMSLKSANSIYPYSLASMYVGKGGHSTSTKLLQIGCRTYHIEYISFDNWQSNRGKFIADIVKVTNGYHSDFKYPVFSIDIVESTDLKYAIDFDINPGLRGTGIDKLLTPKAVIQLMREANRYFEN